jgi:hypothetical protein
MMFNPRLWGTNKAQGKTDRNNMCSTPIHLRISVKRKKTNRNIFFLDFQISRKKDKQKKYKARPAQRDQAG